MRVSVRKAVKLAAIVTLVLLLNVLIGFNLSKVSDSSNKSGKLSGHLARDKGEPLVERSGSPQPNNNASQVGNIHQQRQQRSAKSVPRSTLDGEEGNEDGAWPKVNAIKKRSPANLSTELAASQPGSHGRATELSDIFISVKTSGQFHNTRLPVVLQTWYLLAQEQTYFFTDTDDSALKQSLGGHIINTNCTPTHTRQALCCKTSVEFDAYLSSKKRWMCHFDDDAYVNVPALLDLVRGYSHREDWYLGKPSLKYPMEVKDPDNHGVKVAFWFATGSGYCISRGLALKMMPHAGTPAEETADGGGKVPVPSGSPQAAQTSAAEDSDHLQLLQVRGERQRGQCGWLLTAGGPHKVSVSPLLPVPQFQTVPEDTTLSCQKERRRVERVFMCKQKKKKERTK